MLRRKTPARLSPLEIRFQDRAAQVRRNLLQEVGVQDQSWCLRALRDPIEAVRNDAIALIQNHPTPQVAPELAALNYRQLKCLRTIQLPHPCSHLAMTPDGKTIAATGRDDRLYLWSEGTLQSMETGEHQARSIRWSLDGQTLWTGGVNGTVCEWDRQGTFRRSHQTHDLWVTALAIDAQGLISASRDQTLGQPFTPATPLTGHNAAIEGLATTGAQILSIEPKGLSIWDRSTGTRQYSLPAQDPLSALAVHPRQNLCVTGDRASKLTLWNTDQGVAFDVLLNWSDRPTQALAWSADGAVIFQTCGMGINIWYWRRAWYVHTLVGHRWAVIDLAVSIDGRTIASLGLDGRIKLWGWP
jgi:WD40 repeat protein